MPIFPKYVFWIDESDIPLLRRRLSAKGRTLHTERKSVCGPLAIHEGAAVVPPDTWRRVDFCKKPLSWYWISPYAGRYLVISVPDLTDDGFQPEIILRPSPFRPDVLPNRTERETLFARPAVFRGRPVRWEDLTADDPETIQRWMALMGIRGIRYEQLFLDQCANHANFLDPVYFLRKGTEKIPYSIGPTRHICSACLELFNVIGDEFRRKLVVPCPGAVIYGGMAVNRYIEVETTTIQKEEGS
jgi:hypothetical protein